LPGDSSGKKLFTVGHSTQSARSVDELVELVRNHGITELVDVRRYPQSRRNPAFDRERLGRELRRRGIQYRWEGDDLGGIREGGYWTYMTTPTFAAGLLRLDRLARKAPTVIMCAEASPAACHRRFIAREMTARGYRVQHIGTRSKPTYAQPLPADTQPP
jgi:uncharacterized protein (DUF488 family)